LFDLGGEYLLQKNTVEALNAWKRCMALAKELKSKEILQDLQKAMIPYEEKSIEWDEPKETELQTQSKGHSFGSLNKSLLLSGKKSKEEIIKNAAATQIQKTWRGFQVRSNNPLHQGKPQIKLKDKPKQENSIVQDEDKDSDWDMDVEGFHLLQIL
jgi:hypothetical protein